MKFHAFVHVKETSEMSKFLCLPHTKRAQHCECDPWCDGILCRKPQHGAVDLGEL